MKVIVWSEGHQNSYKRSQIIALFIITKEDLLSNGHEKNQKPYSIKHQLENLLLYYFLFCSNLQLIKY